ncbi:MAG: hypothetical protein ACFFAV_12210, partial [Candidatus Hermodarchaeota archaeon]
VCGTDKEQSELFLNILPKNTLIVLEEPNDIQEVANVFLERIENPEKLTEISFPISVISGQIEKRLKMNPGEIYSILEELSNIDIEITQIDNPDEPEDQKIMFFPIGDEEMCYALANFRPDEYSNFRISITKNFLKALKAKREKRSIFQLKKEIPDTSEMQKSWKEVLNNLYKYYPLYTEQLNNAPDTQKLLKQIVKWKNVFSEKKNKNFPI